MERRSDRMKVISLVLLVGLLVVFCAGIKSEAADMSGREIMEKVKDLQKAQDEEETLSMQLIDSKGRVKARAIVRYTIKDENDLSKIMIRFHQPSDVSGTGLLTWEQKERDDDQWVYLPATKKSKRIVSGNRKGKFMGTDFTYGDLRPENLDKHKYNVVGSEAIDGKDCFVIDALAGTEKEKKESGYSKRKLWVRKDIYFVIKKEYYDTKDKLQKIETTTNLKNVSGTIWRANTISMENIKKKHKTVLQSEGRDINKGVSINLFTVRELEKGR